METKIKGQIEKAISNDDSTGFRKELAEALAIRILELTPADLWPIFQKAAKISNIDWRKWSENIYDDGIDYSQKTRELQSKVIKKFVNDIMIFIQK